MFGYVLPVDGAAAGPEMIVLGALVVVEVELRDAGLEQFEGGVDADVGLAITWGLGEVGVAYVEADADAVEVADAEDLQNVLGRGDFVLQVFDQEADSEGMGEG